MTRLELFNKVKALYPTYWVGQKQGICESPYLVLKYKQQYKSLDNAMAGWQYVDIMIYVPWHSMEPMDIMIDSVKEYLKNELEFTGGITPDFIDQEYKAFMRSIEFRMPKVIE